MSRSDPGDIPPVERSVRCPTVSPFDSDRATTQVLGFALMFAVVMTTFAIYQADVVPEQNEAIEHQHNQELDGEMRKLSGAVRQAVVEDAASSTTIDTAPSYPKRAVAVNPPAPEGMVRASGSYADGVRLTGFVPATGPARYWDGSERSFDTRMLSVRPNYNRIEGARYHFENGLLVKHYANGRTRLVRGRVVSGTDVEITTLSGDLSRGGDSTTVVFRPVSTWTDHLDVTGDGTNPTIRFPTRLPAADADDYWQRRASESASIVAATAGGGSVTLELNGSKEYDLRVTRLTVDTAAERDTDTSPAYVTADRASVTTTVGSSASITLQARDRFGNPVSGTTVELDAADDDLDGVLPDTVTTGPDGTRTLTFTPQARMDTSFDATVGDGSGVKSMDVGVEVDAADASLPKSIYTSGQMVDGFDELESLTLKKGRMVRASEESCLLIGDVGGLVGGLLGGLNCADNEYNTVSGTIQFTDEDSKYRLSYVFFDGNADGDLSDTEDPDGWGPKRADSGSVVIEKLGDAPDEGDGGGASDEGCEHSGGEAAGCEGGDGDSGDIPADTVVFEGTLTDDAQDDVLTDDGVAVLDESNYEDGGWTDDDYEDAVDITDPLFVRQADGRVTVDGTGSD